MKNLHRFIQVACAFAALLSTTLQAHSQVVFEDQFNAPIDLTSKNGWTYYGPSGTGSTQFDATIAATHFGNAPYVTSQNGVSFARLTLNTYSPFLSPGSNARYFEGTEMYSRTGFGPPGKAKNQGVLDLVESATGFEFEARIRYPDNVNLPQKRGVAAFWTYWNHGISSDITTDQYKAHEIDYEMFYRDSYNPSPPAPQQGRILQLQNYRDFNLSGTNTYGTPSITKQDTPRFLPDWKEWNTVKIKWTPKADGEWLTQWFVKRPLDQDYQFLGEEGTIAPNKWMTVRFNIWNYANSGNPAVSDPAQNRSYFLDVDWVKVSKVAPATVSVTEVGGVAASPSTTTTVPNLSSVKGQVAGSTSTVGQINVVIERLSDGYKWRSYGTPGRAEPTVWSGHQLSGAVADLDDQSNDAVGCADVGRRLPHCRRCL